MAFDSIGALLHMHGYAPYVWPAWGVVLGALMALGGYARIERQQVMNELKRRQRRERANHDTQA